MVNEQQPAEVHIPADAGNDVAPASVEIAGVYPTRTEGVRRIEERVVPADGQEARIVVRQKRVRTDVPAAQPDPEAIVGPADEVARHLEQGGGFGVVVPGGAVTGQSEDAAAPVEVTVDVTTEEHGSEGTTPEAPPSTNDVGDERRGRRR